jgi:hypothetical protein
VTPDYVFASSNFLDAVADSLDFSGWDTIAWTAGELPTNGVDALHEDFRGTNRRVEVNSPTNFAGEVGLLPEPSSWLTQAIGAVLLAASPRRRHRR